MPSEPEREAVFRLLRERERGREEEQNADGEEGIRRTGSDGRENRRRGRAMTAIRRGAGRSRRFPEARPKLESHQPSTRKKKRPKTLTT